MLPWHNQVYHQRRASGSLHCAWHGFQCPRQYNAALVTTKVNKYASIRRGLHDYHIHGIIIRKSCLQHYYLRQQT